jgi:hypothetical protein
VGRAASARPALSPRPSRAALVILAIGLLPTAARAGPCIEAAQRLGHVRQQLNQDAVDGRRWTAGWAIGLGSVALGGASLALTRSDRGERAELLVGAGKSVLGLVPLFLRPVPAIRDAAKLGPRANETADDDCAALPEAEALLRRSADDEAFARGWLSHSLALAINAGGLLIVGLKYDRWRTGIAGALIGAAVGEAQIFTRPSAALRSRQPHGRAWRAGPLLRPGTVGMQIVGLFGR